VFTKFNLPSCFFYSFSRVTTTWNQEFHMIPMDRFVLLELDLNTKPSFLFG